MHSIYECKSGTNNNKVTWNKLFCTCGSWPFQNFCTYAWPVVCSRCLNTASTREARYLPSFSQPFWSMNNMQMNHHTLFFSKKISFGMFYIEATTNCRDGKPLWRWISKILFHTHPTVSSLLTTLESRGKAVHQLPLLSTQVGLISYWKGFCQSLLPWIHVLHTWYFGQCLLGLYCLKRNTTCFQ